MAIATTISDHLWQSLLFAGLVCALVALTRRNAACVRLWLWRLAAIKLFVPFALVSVIGSWWAFPVRFPGEPPPAQIVSLVAEISRWSKVDGGWLPAWARVALMVALLLATAAAARGIVRAINAEAMRARLEELRLESDPDDREPSVGFVRAALMTLCAIIVISIPLLEGSVRASVHAHERLEINTRALAEARVILRPAKPGMGSRFFVNVDDRGVWIRNVTLQELAGLAYGVSRFMVRGRHFQEHAGADWMLDYRYDVQIAGSIIEPDTFDTYALRQPITRELAKNLGLEIYVNNSCQPPCGRWGDRVLVEIEPGRWALVDKPATD
jgi:hypothetical protein